MKRKITDWKAESERFNGVADIYDKYRPSYPMELIDAIEEKAGLKSGSKVLEIGAGSGKATELFLERGYHMTCIEPGEDLAERGLARLSQLGQVEYRVGRFEKLENIESDYEALVSAQAFHWVPRPEGYKLAADALTDNGHLALFWNMYLKPEGDLYDELSQLCHDYSVLFMQNQFELDAMISEWRSQIGASGYFNPPEVVQVPWTQEDTYDDFINFLSTGSGYIGLEPNLKAEFDISAKEIFERAGGKMKREFSATLFLSKKLK